MLGAWGAPCLSRDVSAMSPVCKRSKKAVLVASAAGLVAAGILWIWPPKEPVYEGKPLREYLYDLGGTGENITEDIVAFIEFGTNAVPYVRRALRTKDSAARSMLVWLARRQSLIRLRVRSAVETRQAALNAYRGILEAAYEGKADPAVVGACAPQVRALLSDPDPTTKFRAEEIVGSTQFTKCEAKAMAKTR
jgi:hypothetical protein